MNDGFKLVGTVVIERRRKDGTVIEREEVKNTVVNSGLERVAKLMNKGAAGVLTPFGYIGIGTGTTGALATDTTLETEVTREEADNSGGAYEADYKSIWEKTFTFGSGESYAITEAGILDSAVVLGSTMFDRFTFSAKNVDADTDLYVKVTVTLS